MKTRLHPLSSVDFGKLTAAFNLAYSDYKVPLQLAEAQLRAAHHYTDMDARLSQVAVIDNEIVGMGFLCVRHQRGWIGGMGVIPECRRQGVGRLIMEKLIENGRERGLKTIQLEVIEGNTPAYLLYLDLGFKQVRRLLIIQAKLSDTVFTDTPTFKVRPTPVASALDFYSIFHDVQNPWQRESPSLRKASDLSAWVAEKDGQIVTYVIGHITEYMIQIMDAAFFENNDAGLGAILTWLWQQHPEALASMVNIPDDDLIWSLFKQMGFTEHLAQIEMRLNLAVE